MKEQSTKDCCKEEISLKWYSAVPEFFVILIFDTDAGFSGDSVLSERICNIYIQCDVSDGDYSSCVYY